MGLALHSATGEPAAPAGRTTRNSAMISDDASLLREFAERRAEAAFAELVRRHLDAVYSSALRRCSGDTHRARDVAQQVFIALARNAEQLVSHPALAAWLFTATRNAAIKLVLAEQRRRERETAAMNDVALESAAAEPAVDWRLVAPVLERALDELNEADRTAVVLRFFQQRSFAEIAVALRTKENAARMRTERALEKLRERLAARGIRSAGAALGVALAKHAVSAAPAGLAAGTTELALGALGTAGAISVFAVLLQWLRVAAASGWVWSTTMVVVVLGGAVLVWEGTAPVTPPEPVGATENRPLPPPIETSKFPGPSRPVVAEAPMSRPLPPPSGTQAVWTEPAVAKVWGNRELGETLLQASMKAYARLSSYRDEGVASEQVHGEVTRRQATFQTYFVRSGRWMAMFWHHVRSDSGGRAIAEGSFWVRGNSGFYHLAGAVDLLEMPSPSSTLITASESTFGASRHVPDLLFGETPALVRTVYRTPEWLGEEEFEGTECYRLRALRAEGVWDELWLAKSDLLIRRHLRRVIASEDGLRVVQPGTNPRPLFVEEIRRAIRINETILEQQFAFPAKK